MRVGILTLDVREGAEEPARAVARLLHVVALGGLVYLGVELLLGARVAVPAAVARLAVGGLAPLLAVLHVGARRAAVLVLARRPPFVLYTTTNNTSTARRFTKKGIKRIMLVTQFVFFLGFQTKVILTKYTLLL